MEKGTFIIELEYKIDTLRIHMIQLAQSNGFNHPDTIKCSQELDVFLNKYQKLKSN
ncbi:aspartyl-phosphate phosphatase Spo0E family protein [Alkalihalobacillus sp. MEB130]|uniref:aspartyl-phosphate phosphatase Spo0E family protein n=1 Tax=Alkalihalobacillus sp. MEB130 TaxID=2976704 RepID=UPI0028DFC198|nr:aspartyl-phosphate phosphatase Spo0E family protein [Alkalihalobacillus sp. MEB130]MDT8860753.1 aspartyl-phosphate phosphatase Spo0E family protein [Alkalihalobacillus sp. MEB130]